MTDALSAVSEAERNAFPTLSMLSENDVDNIWSNVTSFIERQMFLQKGVHVVGLGTFTFSQQKLDVGNKHMLIKRPIFLLSERLAHCHGLKQVKALPAGEVPVVQLNYTALSVESPFDRDQVEGCVRETLLLLRRAISTQRPVLFSFHNIGLLSFHHPRVRMKFNRDFVTAIDGTGNVLCALSNRLGTSNSLVSVSMSNQQRQEAQHVLLLPSGKGTERQERAAEEMGCPHAPVKPETTEEAGRYTQCPQRPNPRPTLNPAKVNGICLTEELEIPPPSRPVTRSTVSFSPLEGILREEVEEPREKRDEDQTCEDHSRAGQELCYLCMQRAQRNVPVHMEEERLREQKDWEKILLHKEQQKDLQYLQREQDQQQLIRENNQKVAAFNLGVADAVKERGSAQPNKVYDSYIFRGRSLTPAHPPKQRLYLQELLEQADCRRSRETHACQAQDLIDRLCQVQLADEITELKQQQQQQKIDKVKCYKSALDRQLEEPNKEVPGRQPDSEGPMFGLHDCLPQALQAQRQRAKDLYMHQFQSTTQRMREAQLSRAAEQRREMEMINRTNREMITDRILRHDRHRRLRTGLEDTWGRSMEVKRVREQEERNFSRAGCRLLMDQCSGLQRCLQCKRRTSYCGGTNIWKETRYIPGSRLMV